MKYVRYVNAADYAMPTGMAGVANGAQRATRQTDTAWEDVR